MSKLVWSKRKPIAPGYYWFIKQGGPLEPQLIPVPEIFEYLADEDTIGLYAGPVNPTQLPHNPTYAFSIAAPNPP